MVPMPDGHELSFWATYFGAKDDPNLLQWVLGSPAGLKIKLLSRPAPTLK